MMEILKIKSTHPESQGEFVLINAEDFNPETMVLWQEDAPKEKPISRKKNVSDN